MIKLLHESIDHWAGSTPGKQAFRFLDRSLTYRELSEKSARLAGILKDHGVRRGDRVGVYLRKSLETPVAVYGIMKAGAAFVPLDPAAPAARIKSMLEHCGIRCLITNPDMRENLITALEVCDTVDCIIGVSGLEWQNVQSIGWVDVEKSPIAAPVGLAENDIAYIMYTSGSTGIPKGITHTHSSGLAYARMITQLYDVQSSDRFGNHAPLHFDISTFDYFGAPLCGATTIIIPEPYMILPASLSELMEKERLTLWFSVPHALIQLLIYGSLEKRDLGSLRWVIFGGEPFPPKHLRALMAQWPQARFSNSYGPAEVNMCAYYHVDEPVGEHSESIPIGQVWDIAEGLIVDENDQPVTPGKQGELLVRSPTRMQGYWQEPALNQKCFFIRPVSEDVAETFYRTGDLVSDSGVGRMMFLGRKDRQIKMRGFRIELDEIEFVLAKHHEVEETAAYVISSGDRIEAAVTLRPGSKIDCKQLAQYCTTQLPTYAVPQIIRIMDTFPRTTSQKIDRRELGKLYTND